jgi:hypothetical protein
MTFTAYCWLLVALTSPTALAQTHLKQKPVRKHGVVRRRVTEHVSGIDVKKWPYYREERADCGQPEERSDCGKMKVVATLCDATLVYTYVEQMPTLPEASGMVGIIAALKRRLLVPPSAPEGHVFVQFVVTKEGMVSQPKVLKGLRADVDSAVVSATRQLPCFVPGKHIGQPVPVSLTLPVTIVEQRP